MRQVKQVANELGVVPGSVIVCWLWDVGCEWGVGRFGMSGG